MSPLTLFSAMSVPGRIGTMIILLMLLTAIFSPILSPFDHQVPSGDALLPPGPSHLLGTDDLGIDLWAQICNGSRVSLLVGFGTALLAGIGGGLIGIMAGYYGGWIDRGLTAVIDTMMVIPHLPMMIVLGAFFGPSIRNIIIVIALLSWTRPARTVRASILSIKQESYIKAARGWGASFPHLTAKHFFPAALPIVLVSMIRIAGHAIVAEAGMAFLGLGDPLSKSWGIILNRSINFSGIYFTEYWKWWVMSPLAALILLVLSVALLGRDL
jgi:peptide/nickel transport system permease protein